MSLEAILALVALALLANLALLAASPVSAPSDDRDPADASGWGAISRLRRSAAGWAATADPSSGEAVPGDLHPAVTGRVVRVATWTFLFAATTIVAATGLWADRQPAIFGLLALAGLYALAVHDRLVPRLSPARLQVIESVLALAFAGALIGLTGGAASPFFFALPLLVGGVALAVSPRGALALAAAAGLTYLLAVIATGDTLGPVGVTMVGVNLAALTLIAYVGMAVGREQRRVRAELHRRATIDPLTGMRTRAHLFTALEREVIRSQRTGRRFCLLMIDLDGLKAVNDRFGHSEGDRVLRGVGEVIRAGIRRIDTAARYGGDEFVVLLPETDPTGGWVLAEKIRLGVAGLRLDVGGETVRTSASVGLVTFPDDGESVGDLLIRADAAMYDSKRAGRDRVTGVPTIDVVAGATGSRRQPV